MSNLSLPEKIKESVRNYILQTHETKTQQQEFMKFEEDMPPSKNITINALNFKKVLTLSPGMIALRLGMRDEFRSRLNNLTIKDLDNPNREEIDPNEGDKVFRSLIKKMIYSLTIKHIKPEEIVIM